MTCDNGASWNCDNDDSDGAITADWGGNAELSVSW